MILESHLSHIPLKYRCPIKKNNRIRHVHRELVWLVFLKPQSCTFDTFCKVSSTILHKYYDHVEFSHPVIYGPTLDWVANPRLRFIFSCWYDKDLNNVVKLKTHVGMCQGATWKSEIRSPKEQDHWLLYFKSTKPSTSIHCLLL